MAFKFYGIHLSDRIKDRGIMLQNFEFTKLLNQFVTPESIALATRVILILLLGIPLIKLIRKLTSKMVGNKLSAQSEQLIIRAVYYLSFLILLVTLLNELGFKLSALLGAAGVLGIAVGFASQTSISNIISGIFLISEKPFKVGDYIQVGDVAGTVHSIDLLSIKLDTPDNRFVRVPNETMIKSEVINFNRYDIRRVNLEMIVALDSDLELCLDTLRQVASQAKLSLKDKSPFISLDHIGPKGIQIILGAWCRSADYFALKNELIILIKESFATSKIELPYMRISIHDDTNKINLVKEG